MPKQAVVIQSNEACPAGSVGEAAMNHGYELRQVLVNASSDPFPEPEGIDLLLITGSDEHWHEIADHPHLQTELAFIEAAIDAGARVFGMCFGGQALALALGGSVAANQRSEIGWSEVETNDPYLIAPGPWFEWHEDGFTVPPKAELVAWNDSGPQAFVQGGHLGLQFHPELSPAMLARWQHELPPHIDRAALVEETASRADLARERAMALFKAFEMLGRVE